MGGVLAALEGLDGAGKNTLVRAVSAELDRRGYGVATLAFPRYGTLHADLAADALHGRLPGVADSPEAMALLFALDRQAAAPRIDELLAANDVVLLDRYAASNAAYTGARWGADRLDEAADWVAALEFTRLGLRRPDVQLLLATPVAVAAERAGRRSADRADRPRDRYERDPGLQADTAAAYRRLAERSWAGPWQVLETEVGAGPVCDLLIPA